MVSRTWPNSIFGLLLTSEGQPQGTAVLIGPRLILAPADALFEDDAPLKELFFQVFYLRVGVA
jgi:hypothetical protein